MYTQTLLIAALAVLVEARFAQEQVPIPAISALGAFGSSGQAATLAGQSISFLLAAANPCGKLTQADLIVSTLGTDDQVIAAARGLAGAEQNFNPFVVSIPSICSDPTLPTTLALRGVVPLIDPAVTGSILENANAASSLTTPFDATDLSVAEVMAANGFANLTTKAVDGTVGAAPASGSGSGSGSGGSAVVISSSSISAPEPVVTSAVAIASSEAACIASTTFVTVTRDTSITASSVLETAIASSTASPAVGNSIGAVTNAITGNFAGFVTSSLGLDFGTCTPTIKFEAGLNGRKTTEFTFQAIDPVVNKGQQEALNPNIITNRICDQMGNVCGASDAGKAACLAAKAQILALGTRDQSTADTWNTALGFAGTDTNPDLAPQTDLVGHT